MDHNFKQKRVYLSSKKKNCVAIHNRDPHNLNPASDVWLISFAILSRYFHLDIFSGVETSSLSIWSSSREKTF